jgi:hypothetical protein
LCKNKHGASKIIDTFETYHPLETCSISRQKLELDLEGKEAAASSKKNLAATTPSPPPIGSPPPAGLASVGRGGELDLWLEFSNRSNFAVV